ncbi:MAG: response regulator, partial [Deltaproteobacteria bacterium]
MRILILDDEPLRVAALTAAARRACPAAHVTSTAGDPGAATDDARPGLLVIGPARADPGGADLVRALRARCRDLAVLVVSGRDTADAAVEAMKAGAGDYVVL